MDDKKIIGGILISLLLLFSIIFLITVVTPEFGIYLNYKPDFSVISIFRFLELVLSKVYLIYAFHFIDLDAFWWNSVILLVVSIVSIYTTATFLKIKTRQSFAKATSIAFFILSSIFIIINYWTIYSTETDISFEIFIVEFFRELLILGFGSLILFFWLGLVFNFERQKLINSIKKAFVFSLGLAIIEIITSFIGYGYYNNQYYIGYHFSELISGVVVNTILWSVVLYNIIENKITKTIYIFALLYITPEILILSSRSGQFLEPVLVTINIIAKSAELVLLYFLIMREHKNKKS